MGSTLLRIEFGGASSSLKELILIEWGCKYENTIPLNPIALRMAKTPSECCRVKYVKLNGLKTNASFSDSCFYFRLRRRGHQQPTCCGVVLTDRG